MCIMPYRLYLFELFITRLDNRTFSPYFVKSGPLKETDGAEMWLLLTLVKRANLKVKEITSNTKHDIGLLPKW